MEERKGERRRGEALEGAVLAAAWAELLEVGYGKFTMEGVAARAQTSRPVIYRRWPNRAELAMAALRDHRRRNTPPLPDTGALRSDLIAVLEQVVGDQGSITAMLSLQMGEYFLEAKVPPADLRASLLQGEGGRLATVMARAVERGEVDVGRLTPRIANLPMDLLRNEIIMTFKAVSKAVIVEIVDEIFLPLVRVAH